MSVPKNYTLNKFLLVLAGHLRGNGPRSATKISMIETGQPAIMSEGEAILKTAPFDSRFSNQNQTRNCWQNYVDNHRCHKIKGEEYEPCEYFKRVYKSLCPNAWVEKWDDQMQEGIFAAKI